MVIDNSYLLSLNIFNEKKEKTKNLCVDTN